MPVPRWALLPATALLCLPLASQGYELTIGLDAAMVHDTNFFRTETDEESADSIEPGATLDLTHEGDRLRFQAWYMGSYQFYDDHEDADGPEQRFRLRGSYDLNRLTTLHLDNRFRNLRNLRFTQEDIIDGDTGLDPTLDRYRKNDLELRLHRDLSRTWEVEVAAVYQFINFNDNLTRSDSDSVGANARLLYRFAPRHRFGAGLSWVQQDFDGDNIRLDAEAEFVVADLVWVFDIAEQVQLTVHGGPAWIETMEDPASVVQQTEFVGEDFDGAVLRANVFSCGFDDVTGIGLASNCDFVTPGADPIPADNLGGLQNYSLTEGAAPVDDEETTFFGGIILEARFGDWVVDTELQRQQSPPSGDALAAELSRWRWGIDYAPPLGKWSAFLAGSIERREAFSSSTIIDYTVTPGPQDAAQRDQAFGRSRDPSDHRDAITALFGVKRQFTPHFSAEASATYRQTDRQISDQSTEVDNWFFALTLSYVFDTIRF